MIKSPQELSALTDADLRGELQSLERQRGELGRPLTMRLRGIEDRAKTIIDSCDNHIDAFEIITLADFDTPKWGHLTLTPLKSEQLSQLKRNYDAALAEQSALGENIAAIQRSQQYIHGLLAQREATAARASSAAGGETSSTNRVEGGSGASLAAAMVRQHAARDDDQPNAEELARREFRAEQRRLYTAFDSKKHELEGSLSRALETIDNETHRTVEQAARAFIGSVSDEILTRELLTIDIYTRTLTVNLRNYNGLINNIRHHEDFKRGAIEALVSRIVNKKRMEGTREMQDPPWENSQPGFKVLFEQVGSINNAAAAQKEARTTQYHQGIAAAEAERTSNMMRIQPVAAVNPPPPAAVVNRIRQPVAAANPPPPVAGPNPTFQAGIADSTGFVFPAPPPGSDFQPIPAGASFQPPPPPPLPVNIPSVDDIPLEGSVTGRVNVNLASARRTATTHISSSPSGTPSTPESTGSSSLPSSGANTPDSSGSGSRVSTPPSSNNAAEIAALNTKVHDLEELLQRTIQDNARLASVVSALLPVVGTPAVGAPLPPPPNSTPVGGPPPVMPPPPTGTAPVVTAPVVTAPVGTAPVVTAPVVTAPVVTAPVGTAPVVTAPVVTPPPAPIKPPPPRRIV